VCAPNGFGKSALLKSLYDTLGAEPHRIDQSWKDARVISMVDFEMDGRPQTILKTLALTRFLTGTENARFRRPQYLAD
jgi:ABC-type cobalamin/Fe3+-siderophores transport system ATPase subunit